MSVMIGCSRNIAKSFCKLYYKQQETLSVIGIPANGNQNVTFDVASGLHMP